MYVCKGGGGGVSQKIFRPGLKIKGGGPGPPGPSPGSATAQLFQY